MFVLFGVSKKTIAPYRAFLIQFTINENSHPGVCPSAAPETPCVFFRTTRTLGGWVPWPDHPQVLKTSFIDGPEKKPGVFSPKHASRAGVVFSFDQNIATHKGKERVNETRTPG